MMQPDKTVSHASQAVAEFRAGGTWALVLVIIFGIGLRLWNAAHDPALWLDEVFSVKMAESPLLDLLLAVPRFDTHPPLYYVQLHLWSLIGSGDRWMILNSVFLDVLVILSLVALVGRVHGRHAGFWAAAVYAVLPLSVFFAENVRMYAMFFLLVVWLWYLLERRVAQGAATAGMRLATILLGIAATLTHGLGFFVVFFVFLHALVRLHSGSRHQQGLRSAMPLVLDYVPVALASLYSLGIASFRSTVGIEVLDLDVIGIHLAISLFGMNAPKPELVGYLAAILLLLPSLFSAASRGVVIWLILLPAVVLVVLSVTVKSVFMYRTLGLFLPFLAISLGLFFSTGWRDRKRPVQVLAGLVPALLAAAALNSSLSFVKAGYNEIAAIWADKAGSDAVLFVDGPIDLWGVTRYLDGVPTYSALDVQPPVRDGMLRVKQRLNGSWLDRAGLFGRTDHLVLTDGREIWFQAAEGPQSGLSTYWILVPDGVGCLREGDEQLRTYVARGQIMLECQAAAGSSR